MDFKQRFLSQFYEEIEPRKFYRYIFRTGELQQKNVYDDKKYNGIVVELGADKIRRFTVTDDLEVIDELLKSKNFTIISPISYAGKSRASENARFMYALAIDLDGVSTEDKLTDLFHQINKVGYLPCPTFTVISGSGLHLYYVFEQPVPLFKNIVQQLTNLKNDLTRKIWNGYVTDFEDKIQYQSIFQGFRLVGGVTKSGSRTKAYQTGKRVTIDYLNDFLMFKEDGVKQFTYKSDLTLEQAKKLYPEWYSKRIVQQRPKDSWICNRAVYDWWLRRLLEIKEGHRYYGVMCLAIYAKKCGITREELEADAFGMVDRLDELTQNEENHFTRSDVLCALELYNDNYITFPIDTISKLTEIPIEKNKRNGRKLEQHIKMVNALRIMRRDVLGEQEYKNNGRPTAQKKVLEWQLGHPDGKKADCIRETGLSKPTVYKWWNER